MLAVISHVHTKQLSHDVKSHSNSYYFSTVLNHPDSVIIATTVSTTILFVIISFIIGYLCGHFSQKQKHSVKTLNKTGTSEPLSTSTGVSSSKHDPRDLEMMENVAYGPLSINSMHT